MTELFFAFHRPKAGKLVLVMLFSIAPSFIVDFAYKSVLYVFGTEKVGFERSTAAEHAGRPVLVLQIVEILHPMVIAVLNHAGRVCRKNLMWLDTSSGTSQGVAMPDGF
ncbi:hypothetical protein B0H13DRAFT_1884080 [Mycena leptocephala]|nr:hypothetical protein B0H13DRAFT_1884080 [Mycena leptocephala]